MHQSKQQRNEIQKQKRRMIFQIKWGVSRYRQDKRTGPIQVHRRDPYIQYLMDEESKRINPRKGLTK